MDTLNEELKVFFNDPQRHETISVNFTLEGGEAFNYRLVHLMLKHSDVEMITDEINKTIFLLGLETLDEKVREKIKT